jgi:signal transduction histidine kinase
LGLGLAFCRLAVEAHGGRIWVDDAPGGGARFNLTLPLAPAQENKSNVDDPDDTDEHG